MTKIEKELAREFVHHILRRVRTKYLLIGIGIGLITGFVIGQII